MKLQKLCCRLIIGSKRLNPSEPLFKSLDVLKISEAYEYCIMLFMFKYYCGLLPKIMKDMFSTANVSRNMVTRQNKNLILPLCNSQNAYNSIRFQGAKIWNKHYKELNLLCAYFTFKSYLKTFILKKT